MNILNGYTVYKNTNENKRKINLDNLLPRGVAHYMSVCNDERFKYK